MHRGLTGRYEGTAAGGEQVRALVPSPLPPVPPLELSHARQQLLERATQAPGRLDSVTLLLPDPGLDRIAATTLRVFGALCQRPLVTLNQVSERTGISYPSAARGMNALVGLGIARELSGRRRNRILAYNR
jgi:hypothetical protein